MEVEEFNFDLPQELIALRPASERDASRLFVLMDGKTEHRHFYDLPQYIEKGDLLLINDTRVLPVRLLGRKKTGGLLEVVLVRKTGARDSNGRDGNGNGSGDGDVCNGNSYVQAADSYVEETWEALYRGRYTGILKVSEELSLEFCGRDREVKVICKGGLLQALAGCGQMPLPPYIKRRPDETDKERYQTVYAKKEARAKTGRAGGNCPGSIAAPTAGLHFTPELLEAVRAKGALVRSLTLHVGRGTFMPVKSLKVEDHRMEREHFEFDSALPEEINDIRAGGGKVFAVGTTTTRAIESFFSGTYMPDAADDMPADDKKVLGSTDIFIYPGYRFRAVDRLVTNFHLPGSTPLMLASAMAGRERLLKAYEKAISGGYRFFSYGDAMLLEGAKQCF